MDQCECGKKYLDEHGHGLCFGCKVQGVSFGKVPQGPSKYFQEKQEIETAAAKGIEVERVDPNMPDIRDKPKQKLKRPKKVEEMAHGRF
jgi:hypothetical protein